MKAFEDVPLFEVSDARSWGLVPLREATACALSCDAAALSIEAGAGGRPLVEASPAYRWGS